MGKTSVKENKNIYQEARDELGWSREKAADIVAKIDNGYKLVMSGEDVYFIEFGTGSNVEPHYQTSVPVFAGSWSMEHSQKYAKQGWWWYGGEPLVGTIAYMPMYYAEKKMREEIPRIVKEVFG